MNSVIYLTISYVIDIRLNGTATEGILEANEDSGWGPVCSNNFDGEVAFLACRQLRLGLPVSYNRSTAIANSSYYLIDLYCSRYNQKLAGCYYSNYGTCNITYLQCSGMYI